MSDQNPIIETNEMNELKKLSFALIMSGKGALELISVFFAQNFDKTFDKLDEISKEVITNKKSDIFIALQNLALLRNIEKKDINEYIKDFREKYGVSEKDLNDKKLTKLITKFNHDDKDIMVEILKKLKYIN